MELTSAAADHGMRLQAARVLLLLRPAGNRCGHRDAHGFVPSSIIDPRSRSEVSLSSLAARSNSPPAAALSELSTRAIRSSASAAAFVCRPQHGKGSPRASWRKVEAAVEHVAQHVMQRHSDRPNTVAAGPGVASDRAEASRLSRAIFGSACGNACDFTVRQHRRHRICVLRIERFDAVCIAFNPETTERRAGRPSLRSTS